jgi:hypothetical protein
VIDEGISSSPGGSPSTPLSFTVGGYSRCSWIAIAQSRYRRNVGCAADVFLDVCPHICVVCGCIEQYIIIARAFL